MTFALLPAFSSAASKLYLELACELLLPRDCAEDEFCMYPRKVRGSFHSSRWPFATVGSMRSSNDRDGLSLSLRKMEKAMKAAMTRPPTVPPTMRIVFVLTPPEEEDWAWATAVDDAVDEVVELGVGAEEVRVRITVGTGVELSVVVVTCVFAVATRAALSSEEEVVTGTGVDEVVGARVGVSGVEVVEGVTTTTAEVVGVGVVEGASELVTTTTFGVV
jgi:hypothetical protein